MQQTENQPAVSIIVGTYNCVEYLSGLWETIDAQTFRDFEIIVVDDASNDGETLAALEAMGDRIRLVKRTSNSQTCELPRYQGAKVARAPLCAFLDADDRWEPEFLEKCVAHLNAHPDDALVHTYVRIIDGDDNPQHIRHENAIPTGDQVARALLKHCFITISAVVARRDIWLETLDESEIIDFGMDQDFFLNIAQRHRIGFIPEVLGLYRRSGTSVSVKKWKRAPRNVNTLNRIYQQGYWKGQLSRAEMKRVLMDAYCEDAEYWRHAGFPDRALWFCRDGLRHNPLELGLWRSAAISLIRRIGAPKRQSS